MNYLITGGNGLIGLNLANRLQNNGNNVILIDNKNIRTKKFKF